MNNKLSKQLKNMTSDDFYKIIISDGNNKTKDWLAKLGNDRIDEMFDPSLIIEKSINCWRSMGFNDDWIRNKLI